MQMLILLPYLLYLFFHGFDVIFSGLDLLFQLLYFVIQHKLKLLQLLIFLL